MKIYLVIYCSYFVIQYPWYSEKSNKMKIIRVLINNNMYNNK